MLDPQAAPYSDDDYTLNIGDGSTALYCEQCGDYLPEATEREINGITQVWNLSFDTVAGRVSIADLRQAAMSHHRATHASGDESP